MIRALIKSKRPTFTQHEGGQKKRVKTNWKRPKGLTNKMRLQKRGHKAMPSQGYRMPKTLRDVDTKSGLAIVYVQQLEQLQAIDPKKQCVVIGKIGMRKKVALLEYAKAHKIIVINIHDIDAYTQRHTPQKKVETPKKAPVQQVKQEKKLTEEEEKKEQEKVLLHKQ
ncbi:MAG: eL32 family ribosomal protein [Candidatus Woesearchaeota archaeon]